MCIQAYIHWNSIYLIEIYLYWHDCHLPIFLKLWNVWIAVFAGERVDHENGSTLCKYWLVRDRAMRPISVCAELQKASQFQASFTVRSEKPPHTNKKKKQFSHFSRSLNFCCFALIVLDYLVYWIICCCCWCAGNRCVLGNTFQNCQSFFGGNWKFTSNSLHSLTLLSSHNTTQHAGRLGHAWVFGGARLQGCTLSCVLSREGHVKSCLSMLIL